MGSMEPKSTRLASARPPPLNLEAHHNHPNGIGCAWCSPQFGSMPEDGTGSSGFQGQCLNSAGVIGTPLASTPSPTFVPNNPSPSFMRAPPPHLPVRRIPSQRIQNHRIQYDFCVFCKNNGEDETYYLGHTLKDDDGRVCCPVLFAYTCPLCGACGPVAHTIKYCPKNKEHQERDVASINELKGLRASTGRMRQDAVTTTFMNAAEYFDANNAAQRPQQTPAPSTFLPTRPFNGHRSGFACSSATPQRMVRSNHEETMNVDKAFQALFPRRD